MASAPKKPSKPKSRGKSDASRKASTISPPIEPDMLEALRQMIEESGINDLLENDLLESEDTPEDLVDAILALDPDESMGLFEDLVGVLTDLRIEANGGDREARREAQGFRAWLQKRLDEDIVGPHLVMLAQAFGAAGFDPGPALEAAITRRLDAHADENDVENSLDGLLDELADQMDGDPLSQFDELRSMVLFVPRETRIGFAANMATSPRRELREISLGFLLESDDEVARTVCEGLAATAGQGGASARFLSRLAMVRRLVSPDRGRHIDTAIAALQPYVLPGEPFDAPKINSLLSTAPDGVGATTLVLHTGRGRSGQMVSLLIKTDLGLTDVTVVDSMSKQAVKELFAASQIRLLPVTPAYAARCLAEALSRNKANGTAVPPAVLYFMELVGLSAPPTDRFEPEALFDDILSGSLLDASDPENQRTAFLKLLGAGVLHSWFEGGEEIDQLLQKNRKREGRLNALLNEYLPTRRGFWIRQCAWTAAFLREQKGGERQHAVWAAILGKQLCAGRPLAESPLMQDIAESTVKAFMVQ